MDSDITGAINAIYTLIGLMIISLMVRSWFLMKRIGTLEDRLRKLENKENK